MCFSAFEAKLSEKGEAAFSLRRPETNSIRAKLAANFKIRVFEESGNTSEDHFSVGINPFSHYAGLILPKTNWYSQSYGLGSKQTFKVLSVDKNGKTSSNRKLSVGIYQNSKHWWYRQNSRNNYSYANGKHVGAIQEYNLTTRVVRVKQNYRSTVEMLVHLLLEYVILKLAIVPVVVFM